MNKGLNMEESVKIKPKAAARPYTLFETADFFGFNKRRLELQLISLAEKETIYAHDIKKIRGKRDYELSFFAVSILIFEIDYSPETHEKLSDFCRDDRTVTYNPYWHTALLFAKKKHLAEKKLSKLRAQKAKMKEDEAFIDNLMRLLPFSTVTVN